MIPSFDKTMPKRLDLCAYATMFLIICSVESYEHFAVRYSHSTCKILSHEVVFNLSCTSRIINRTRRASFEVNLQPGVELDNVYLMVTYNYKFGTVYRQHIIKIEQELCQFIKDSTTSKWLPIFASMWRETGNVLDPCPVKGRRFIKDAYAELDNVPTQVTPAGDWRIDTLASSKINNTKIDLISVSEYIEIKTKTALQWKK